MPVKNGVDAASMFSGIETARTRSSCNFERVGKYWEIVNTVFGDKNRKDEQRVDINKTIIRHYPTSDAVRPHVPGEAVTHRICKKWDSFLGNMKSFIAVCLDMKPEQVTAQHAAELLADADNPFQWVVVECSNRNVVTKAGKDFTEINYERRIPYAEVKNGLTPEAIATFFPDGLLDRLVKMEAEAATQAQAA